MASENNNAPVYKVDEEGKETKYYLQGETPLEISEEQYKAVLDYGSNEFERGQSGAGNSAGLSEANILRLHQEQDPASPFYKGSESDVDRGPSGVAAGKPDNTPYYEPVGDKAQAAEDAATPSEAASVYTTSEVTAANAGIQPETIPASTTSEPNPELTDNNASAAQPQ